MRTQHLILICLALCSIGLIEMADEEEGKVLLRYREEGKKERVVVDGDRIEIEGSYSEEEKQANKLEHMNRLYENMDFERERTERHYKYKYGEGGEEGGDDQDGSQSMAAFMEQLMQQMGQVGEGNEKSQSSRREREDPQADYKRELERQYYKLG